MEVERRMWRWSCDESDEILFQPHRAARVETRDYDPRPLRNGPLVTSTTLLGNRAEPDHGRPLRRADDYRSAPPLAHSSGE